jgi:hypothetical protein
MNQKRQRQLANLEIAETAFRDNLPLLNDTASMIYKHSWKSGQNGI